MRYNYGTTHSDVAWRTDNFKFREYLHKKFNIEQAYYFLGCFDEQLQPLMYKLYKHEEIDKIYLVSGDGDYYRMVRFLRDEGKLGKIMFPVRNRSSTLYRRIEQRYRMYLDDPDVKKKIIYTSES